MSTDDGTAGGFEGRLWWAAQRRSLPSRDALNFHWLRSQQFRFALTSLYGLASILSFIAWLRDRKQRLLFWMAAYTLMPVLEVLLNGLRLPLSSYLADVGHPDRDRHPGDLPVVPFALFASARCVPTAGAAGEDRRLCRRAYELFGRCSVVGHAFRYDPVAVQIADAVLTAFILPLELVPILLVLYAILKRQRLDSARWAVAIFALLSGTWYSFGNIVDQGVRFTHWTIGPSMRVPLFVVWGNSFGVQILLRTLLFLSIVYAVLRYSITNQRRQNNLEREFQNARELQQILVPETLPAIPDFTLTSAYRPAQEVGGDFFQIIPLEGAQQGSTLIVLGDVSGKGLQAAMTVSLIVGAVRTLAKFAPQPAQMLAEINERLHGRLQGGFATCIVLLLNPGGTSFSPVPAILRHFSTNASWTSPEHSRWALTRLPAITSFHCNCTRATIFPFTPMACWKRAMPLASFTASSAWRCCSASGPAPPKPHKKPWPSGKRMTSLC